MGASTTPRPFVWAGLSVGLAALLTVVWGGVYLYRSYASAKAQFVKQAVLSAQVFAESVRAALEADAGARAEEARLQRLTQMFVRGDVLYAQVVDRGRVRAEDRVEAAFPLKLDVQPLPGGRGRVREGRLPDGTPYLDVWRALPGPLALNSLTSTSSGAGTSRAEGTEEAEAEEGVTSYVRIGISMREVGYRLRGEALLTLGLGIALVAAAGLVAFGLAIALGAKTPKPPPAPASAQAPTDDPHGALHGELRVGPLAIDGAAKEVRLNGHPVRLSPKEFELLRLLASQPGRVFSSREILERLWPEGRFATPKDVKQYVYLLRRKLERDPKHPELIVTVKGFGYKLVPPSRPSRPSRGAPSKAQPTAKGEEPS